MSLQHVGSHLGHCLQQWLGLHCQLQKPILESASSYNSWYQQLRNRLWDEDLLAGSLVGSVLRANVSGGKNRRITQELNYNTITTKASVNPMLSSTARVALPSLLFRDKGLITVQPYINQSLVYDQWPASGNGVWGGKWQFSFTEDNPREQLNWYLSAANTFWNWGDKCLCSAGTAGGGDLHGATPSNAHNPAMGGGRKMAPKDVHILTPGPVSILWYMVKGTLQMWLR